MPMPGEQERKMLKVFMLGIFLTITSLTGCGIMPQTCKEETEEDHSIVVVDTNGDEYELGIDEKDNLYSVKDIQNGDYLFTVYE